MLIEAMCLAVVMWGEARGEPVVGQVAVAEVVLERKADPRWPNSICGVVFQSKQFTGITERMVEEGEWTEFVTLAQGVLSRKASSFGANHFYSHTRMDKPWWAEKMHVIAVIGNHTFLSDAPPRAVDPVPVPVPVPVPSDDANDPYEGGSYASFQPVLHGSAEVG